jgi:hypothetical protein
MASETDLNFSVLLLHLGGLAYAAAIGFAVEQKEYALAAALAFWGFILAIATLIKAIRQGRHTQ